jgi:hypothetical protein
MPRWLIGLLVAFAVVWLVAAFSFVIVKLF